MGWGTICSPYSVEQRQHKPASQAQISTIKGLYDELGMDYDQTELDNLTSWEAHKTIDELLSIKKELTR